MRRIGLNICGLVILLVTSSCSREALELGGIDQIPDELGDWACYYSLDEWTLSKGDYVFVNDYYELGYINLNDTLERLIQMSADADAGQYRGDYFEEYYSNGILHIILASEATGKTIGDKWEYKGELEITDVMGNTRTVNVVGECGYYQ
ncbi:MAG: hypothetical protein QNK23_06060 [Crocinitomicaceae bacterium]|nr:hypothetical protein [Crocinitomicaceae bacterium]